MNSGSGTSFGWIDLLNDHNYATRSIQVLLVLEQKGVSLIVDDLKVASAAPATCASDDVKEKYRELLILLLESKGVARSTILLGMEHRLQKRYSTVHDVVSLLDKIKTNSTAEIKWDKWSLHSDMAAVRLSHSVDT
jgi:hypothetical protein